MESRHEGKDAETPWQAGTRMLGINLSVVAAWIGPILVTLWFIAWLLSFSTEPDSPLPTNARPLDVVHHVFAWGGWSTTHPDSIATWIAERPSLGTLAVACVVFGVSLRHDVLVAIGLLVAIQSLGVTSAVIGIILSTLVIALCSAVALDGQEESNSFVNRLIFALDMWTRRVLIEVCAMPLLILVGISFRLFERYTIGDPPNTSADQLAQNISRQLPDPHVSLAEVSADSAARAMAVVLAATLDGARSDDITRNSWKLRRRQPTGAVDLHDGLNHGPDHPR